MDDFTMTERQIQEAEEFLEDFDKRMAADTKGEYPLICHVIANIARASKLEPIRLPSIEEVFALLDKTPEVEE